MKPLVLIPFIPCLLVLLSSFSLGRELTIRVQLDNQPPPGDAQEAAVGFRVVARLDGGDHNGLAFFTLAIRSSSEGQPHVEISAGETLAAFRAPRGLEWSERSEDPSRIGGAQSPFGDVELVEGLEPRGPIELDVAKGRDVLLARGWVSIPPNQESLTVSAMGVSASVFGAPKRGDRYRKIHEVENVVVHDLLVEVNDEGVPFQMQVAPNLDRQRLLPRVQPRVGHPVNGLSDEQLKQFFGGRRSFGRVPTVEEGLGPVFTSSSCLFCHNHPTSAGFGAFSVTRFGRSATDGEPFSALEDLGGPLLQAQCIDPEIVESLPAEADVVVERFPPPLYGVGLIDVIPDEAIVAREGTSPSGDVAGRAHWVVPLSGGGEPRVGRFGWKGSVATVLGFTALASTNEMGITNRFFPSDNAPGGDQALLLSLDVVADPEDPVDEEGMAHIDRATLYQRYLAPPPQTPRKGMVGEEIFEAIGCADCHLRETFEAPPDAGPLAGHRFQPYSDFLLHDMGKLGDGIVEGDAGERDMMTRPLWGLVHRMRFLHDGRAVGGSFLERLVAAVVEHDGEATAARTRFEALGIEDRQALSRFLESLGRVEFDVDFDNRLDQDDWAALYPSWRSRRRDLLPDEFASIADVDGDGDLDLLDFGAFQLAYGF